VPRHLLAGDVGGTKVVLGLFDGPRLLHHERLPSAASTGLEPLCAGFLARHPGIVPASAAFGVAGPVVGGRAQTTNLPWVVEEASLRAHLRCPVKLVNDLEATAHGIEALQPSDLVPLNAGEPVARAPRALLAAGTGLGEAYMVSTPGEDGPRWIPCASEGGHTDFGPRSELEIGLLRHLAARHGHVSVERVVSGMGIREIFGFLASTGRFEIPAALVERMQREDAGAVISREAIASSSPICMETMRIFVGAYGAEAGNLALKVMALGGVYVGGGIAPRVLPLLQGGAFLEGFFGKGRFEPLMRRMPVRVVLNENTALLGAARVAASLA